MTTTFARTTPLVTRLNSEWATVAGRIIDCGVYGRRSGADLLAEIRNNNGAEQLSLIHI